MREVSAAIAADCGEDAGSVGDAAEEEEERNAFGREDGHLAGECVLHGALFFHPSLTVCMRSLVAVLSSSSETVLTI